MKLTKHGIQFKNDSKDILTFVWPWREVYSKNYKLHSYLHGYFSSLANYKKYISDLDESCKKAKILGFSTDDLIMNLVRTMMSDQYVVVLSDLDLSVKSADFWRKVPRSHRLQFKQDIVVLFCKTEKEVVELASSTDTRFGKAYGFSKGNFIAWNEDLLEEELEALSESNIQQ